MPYTNPVIPGFHPDPSVCRVGEDYYLVNSSFEYFPGVPVFHSRDLVNWRQIGHCLTRDSQLPLQEAWSSGGIFAPTIRHHDGRFYMITTNVSNYGHFLVHAADPAGPWSEPLRIPGPGFDPDLFFDDDGRVYMARNSHDHRGIRLVEISIADGSLVGDERYVWPGAEDDLCEGPHLYKINGWYYLFVAEGGTHRGHMETVGRSRSVWGPYEPCPHNPVLSHRAKVHEPIQATGHADLVQAHDGSWWLVFLGIRQQGWGYHHLGRETFLAPVTWDEQGWPVVNGGTAVGLSIDAPGLPQSPWPAVPVRDDFDCPELAMVWNFRKNPDPACWSLTHRAGWLTLHGSARTLDDYRPPAFVGRRQEHFACRVATLLDFAPAKEGEEAGLTVMMNERAHFEIAVRTTGGTRIAVLRKRLDDVVAEGNALAIGDGPVLLQAVASRERYEFSVAPDGGVPVQIGTGLTKHLSQEVCGGFTGVYMGMYATGRGAPCSSPASFDWFDYEPLTEKPRR